MHALMTVLSIVHEALKINLFRPCRIMKPDELIFLSMQEDIEVEPTATLPPENFITFEFPGINLFRLAHIPLWAALHLRELGYCTIRTPEYLSPEYLERITAKEKAQDDFVELPEFIFEHAHLLKNTSIEYLIDELRRLRHQKLWDGIKQMDGLALFINGLTLWEFNEFRPIILDAMSIGKRIETGDPDSDDEQE
ncbi:GINS complex subunit 2 [Enteropsectra breve]|nr:GINS complex subunit 2 [Enteropsectra breve]